MNQPNTPCSRRQEMLDRLLQSDPPGQPTAEDRSHAAACPVCAKTLHSLGAMEAGLEAHFAEVRKTSTPVPPGPALEKEMEPSGGFPFLWKALPYLIVGALLWWVATPAPSHLPPPATTPTTVTPSPASAPVAVPLASPPAAMVVAGIIIGPAGANFSTGQPLALAPAEYSCQGEGAVLHSLTASLKISGARFRIQADGMQLLAGSVRTKVVPSGKPFHVETSTTRVTVMGTEFLVSCLPDGGTQVDVTEGRVQVDTTRDDHRLLVAGENLTIDATGRLVPPKGLPAVVTPPPVIEATPAAVVVASEEDVLPPPARSWQALNGAVERGQTDLVKRLLAAGSDVNAADEEGNTPLHFAVRRGQKTMVELLLERGADPTKKNVESQSALDLASEPGRESMKALLQAPKSAP